MAFVYEYTAFGWRKPSAAVVSVDDFYGLANRFHKRLCPKAVYYMTVKQNKIGYALGKNKKNKKK